MKTLVSVVVFFNIAFVGMAHAQATTGGGQSTFEQRCSMCHGADGNGGELGPPISGRLDNLTDQEIQTTVTQGLPTRGMPAHAISSEDLAQLIVFLRTIQPRRFVMEPYPLTARLVHGQTLSGMVVAEGSADVQLRTLDGHTHLLRRAPNGLFREVSSTADWPSYNGGLGGNRFTDSPQITPANVKHIGPRWIFNMPNASRLEVTPVVADGVMYVTNGNECYALDAGSGRQIWHFQRPRTHGLIGNAAAGINRGVALANDNVFMVSDDARLLALDRHNGKVVWETELADWHHNYNATSAPLAVGNLVITGTAGGEEGVRGFVAAYDATSGKEVWRFWTVPGVGEPGAETWAGSGIQHGGASAWFTGVYDAETDTVFWPTGNPGNDYDGDDRPGDNLFADCILAFDAKTGKLKWHYQTTPHDVWDWDASETPLVIDAQWQGRARKLLAQGNRNGFFYVWDRVSGELLLAKPFVKNLTWATQIGADGRPKITPQQDPSDVGTRVCPSQPGATNWYSPSYSPATGLFYMQTNEKCSIYIKRPVGFEYGRAFLGGTVRNDPSVKPSRILRALDLHTGTVKWELPQIGAATSSGGTLTTATGIVFFCDDSGSFAAANAVSGKSVWSFDMGANWKASPMAYEFDGKELIAVAAGGSIVAFALPD